LTPIQSKGIYAYAYTKGEIEDMTPAQKRQLKQLVMQIKQEFRA